MKTQIYNYMLEFGCVGPEYLKVDEDVQKALYTALGFFFFFNFIWGFAKLPKLALSFLP